MRTIDADALPIKYDGHTVSVWQVDIEEAPTIDAEPVKHGKWTWADTKEEELAYGATAYLPMFQCSCCQRHMQSYLSYDEPLPDDIDFPKYCPNCGAKMDGADNA